MCIHIRLIHLDKEINIFSGCVYAPYILISRVPVLYFCYLLTPILSAVCRSKCLIGCALLGGFFFAISLYISLYISCTLNNKKIDTDYSKISSVNLNPAAITLKTLETHLTNVMRISRPSIH